VCREYIGGGRGEAGGDDSALARDSARGDTPRGEAIPIVISPPRRVLRELAMAPSASIGVCVPFTEGPETTTAIGAWWYRFFSSVT